MTTSQLNAVAIDVVDQYGLAGKHLLRAYRTGTERLVAQLNEGYAKLVQAPAMPAYNETLRTTLVGAQQQLTGFLVGGVARVTEQADLAIDRVTGTTTEGLKRLSGLTERFESTIGAPVVETMVKLNLPVAQLSLTVAGQVAAGTKRLAERVATDVTPVAAATVDATTAADAAVEPTVEATKARTRRAA